MFKSFLKSLNNIIFILNLIDLALLLSWSLLGIWDIMPANNLFFWKVFISLIALFIFNILTLTCVCYLYRKNLKLIDIFEDSDYLCEFQAGDIIFDEGQIDKIMYQIIKGDIKIVAEGKVLEIISDGDIFGEMAIIENLPRTASAICVTPCKLIAIDEKRFYELIQEVPQFCKEVMRTMSHRLRILDHQH